MKTMTTLKSGAVAALALAGASIATISPASAEDQCISYNMGNNQLSYCRNNVEPLFPTPTWGAPTVVQPSVVYTQPAPVVIKPGPYYKPGWQLRKEIKLLRRLERNAYLTRAERKRIKRKIRRKVHRLHGHYYGPGKRVRVATRRAHRYYDSVYAD
ncbi:MAG TPA: hypothetical protein DCS82_05845 [Rhodospirillaceae bacterium]|nr:hypothetical protein [Rhodospirillaceae bacterium]HAT35217.1 hypothetical protein [Rhodospirillaceae bacterium]